MNVFSLKDKHFTPLFTTWIQENSGVYFEDGGGIGRGDRFLPYKLIKRTIEG